MLAAFQTVVNFVTRNLQDLVFGIFKKVELRASFQTLYFLQFLNMFVDS